MNELSGLQRQSSLIAGISLLIMTFAAFFSYGYAHSTLIIPEDALETLENIQVFSTLFHYEILSWVLIILLDIIVAWAFYICLRPVHAEYSLLAGWVRLLYTAILAAAVSQLVTAYIIALENTGASMETSASQVMTRINAFETIWSIGLIVFGVHLLLVGLITFKSSSIPKVISTLLIIAGVSYMLVHVLKSFFPLIQNVTSIIEMTLMLPMTIGELGFGLWLLVKGIKAR
ncbi:DUF4386 domain-containing protein [Halobacillus litoralis]|uniref:DUF4386 domain-containing protein n=1 Tax=Halobacillus litoralis TaxID=45668 RepID=UPI001CFCC9E2|nr:DUF4386 domain-containing protein [Halobacillus litoralis]